MIGQAKITVIGIDASRANRSQRTGVEWYAFHVIQRLKAIVPDTYRVVLYTEEPLRDGLEKDLPSHWESRVLHWPPRKLWTQVRLSWEILVRPPDVLFVPAYVPPLSALFRPKRVLTTLHDPAFITMPSAYSLHGRMFLTLMYRVALAAGRILTVSEFSKRELVRIFKADPERIAVTPLGFDQTQFGPNTDKVELQAVLRRHGIGETPYFLFVGRLETKKNLSGLLTAFAKYKVARPTDDARLVLVGKPGHGYKSELQTFEKTVAGFEAAAVARIRGAVLELGYAAPADMRYLYAGATAFVFPSLYEGFGIPLLEAFACGTPVIASNVTSMPEVAGDAAMLVNPHETHAISMAMARLSDVEAERATLRARGLERVKKFSWDRTAALTWEMLR